MSTTRRDFLKTGALAGAGLVIAFHLPETARATDAAAQGHASRPTPTCAWRPTAPSP